MTQTELFIKMALTNWSGQNKRIDDMIEKYSDEQWMKETAPGRNTGIYLLGHLTAVNDGMIALLRLGERQHPELDEIFLKNPDNSGLAKTSLADLKKWWKEINAILESHFAKMSSDDWFARHNSVNDEDFAKEPHRNKLNIILSRTAHQAYHVGQLAYLK